MNDHDEFILKALNEKPLQNPSPPWKNIDKKTVHGLLCVGFQDNTDNLLVLSADGRFLYDCLTGTVLAENALDEDEELDVNDDFGNIAEVQEIYARKVFDDTTLLAIGIGPIAGVPIRMSGYYGGGLALQTKDGWNLQKFVWGIIRTVVLLRERPIGNFFDLNFSQAQKIFDDEEIIVACGFSSTGQSMVIVLPSTLIVYARTLGLMRQG